MIKKNESEGIMYKNFLSLFGVNSPSLLFTNISIGVLLLWSEAVDLL